MSSNVEKQMTEVECTMASEEGKKYFISGSLELTDWKNIVYDEDLFRYLFHNNLKEIAQEIVELYPKINELKLVEKGLGETEVLCKIRLERKSCPVFIAFIGQTELHRKNLSIEFEKDFDIDLEALKTSKGHLVIYLSFSRESQGIEGHYSCSNCGRNIDKTKNRPANRPKISTLCDRCFSNYINRKVLSRKINSNSEIEAFFWYGSAKVINFFDFFPPETAQGKKFGELVLNLPRRLKNYASPLFLDDFWR